MGKQTTEKNEKAVSPADVDPYEDDGWLHLAPRDGIGATVPRSSDDGKPSIAESDFGDDDDDHDHDHHEDIVPGGAAEPVLLFPDESPETETIKENAESGPYAELLTDEETLQLDFAPTDAIKYPKCVKAEKLSEDQQKLVAVNRFLNCDLNPFYDAGNNLAMMLEPVDCKEGEDPKHRSSPKMQHGSKESAPASNRSPEHSIVDKPKQLVKSLMQAVSKKPSLDKSKELSKDRTRKLPRAKLGNRLDVLEEQERAFDDMPTGKETAKRKKKST
ncbi:unnamed protein product, partial [Mesorhabditis spiculigera]